MLIALMQQPPSRNKHGYNQRKEYYEMAKPTNPGPGDGDKRNDPPPSTGRPGKDNTPPPRPMPKPGR